MAEYIAKKLNSSIDPSARDMCFNGYILLMYYP